MTTRASLASVAIASSHRSRDSFNGARARPVNVTNRASPAPSDAGSRATVGRKVAPVAHAARVGVALLLPGVYGGAGIFWDWRAAMLCDVLRATSRVARSFLTRVMGGGSGMLRVLAYVPAACGHDDGGRFSGRRAARPHGSAVVATAAVMAILVFSPTRRSA